MKKALSIMVVLFSLCDQGHSDSVLISPLETPEHQTARQLVEAVQGAKTSMLGILRDGTSRLWDSPDPQAVLNKLGPHAAEVITLYQSLVSYLQQVLTAAGDSAGLAELQAIAAKTPPLTIHEDGTVTINPPETNQQQ